MVNRTLVEDRNEGLLAVNVVGTQSQLVRYGTVCKDHVNWHTANLLCLSMGFMFADWGSSPRNKEYVPEYVSDHFILLNIT